MKQRLIITRRSLFLLWIAVGCLLTADILFPVSIGLTRAAGVLLFAAFALGLLGFCWRYHVLRWTLVSIYLIIALFMALPGRKTYDRRALRQEITSALGRYEGVRYIWGGENWLGIDCSGLIRRGTMDGTFLYGVRTLNPYLIRRAIVFWWHDASAQEMEAGVLGAAKKITEEKSIAVLNDKNLHPGDFAITRGGVHALAYLGDHQWIEADPGAGKVVRINARSTQNAWFQTPVSILRWQFLEIQHPVRTQ